MIDEQPDDHGHDDGHDDDGLGYRLTRRQAEVIDRSRPIEVFVDGETMHGFEGDTAASLLAADGRRTFFGSVREQRPGGLRRADRFDRDSWVWVADLGLVPAASYRVNDGDVLSAYQRRASTPTAATPIARWQRAGRTAMERIGPLPGARLNPHAQPNRPAWLASLRRNGVARVAPGPARAERADVLVVGAGLAGLAAARAAADAGAWVVLVEADEWLGGSFRWSGAEPDRRQAAQLAATVAAHGSVTVLTSAVVSETRPDGRVLVVERWGEEEAVVEIHAAAVILAAGTLERPLAFEGNHLPGVMVPSGARRLMELWAVRPGDRALVVCDSRHEADSRVLSAQLEAAGVELAGVAVVAESAGHLQASGELQLEEVLLPSGRRVATDLLITSFGSTVSGSLVNGLGGLVTRGADGGCLTIANLPATAAVVGAMAGQLEIEALQAHAAGVARRLTRLVLDPPKRHRVAPPPAPVVVADTDSPVVRSVAGLLDAEADLRVEHLDGFAASAPAASERLVAAGRRSGLSAVARLNLADLSRSATAAAGLEDLILADPAPLLGPTLGALAMLDTSGWRLSPLADLHRRAGARFVGSDGWHDVLHYGDPEAEAAALRVGVGLRDATGEGWFQVCGPAADAVVAALVTARAARPSSWHGDGDGAATGGRDGEHRDGSAASVGAAIDAELRALAPGRWQQVEGLTLLRVAAETWQVMVPVGQAREVHAVLAAAGLEHQPWEVVTLARNEDEVRLRLCGPSTPEVLEALELSAPVGVRQAARFGALTGHVLARSPVDVELHAAADAGRALWAAVLVAGDRLAIAPVGIAAMDTYLGAS